MTQNVQFAVLTLSGTIRENSREAALRLADAQEKSTGRRPKIFMVPAK